MIELPKADAKIAAAHQDLNEAHDFELEHGTGRSEVEIREDELRAAIRKGFHEIEKVKGWHEALDWLIEQIIHRTHESKRGF